MRPEGTPQLFAVRNCSFDILNLRGEQVCKILMVGRLEVGEGGIPIGRVVELFRKEAESSLAVVDDRTPRLHPNFIPLLLVLKQMPRARSFWDTLRATTWSMSDDAAQNTHFAGTERNRSSSAPATPRSRFLRRPL